MPEKLQILLRFIAQSEAKVEGKPKRGRPYLYPQLMLLLFFIIMQLKGIHHFKSMEKYIKYRYEQYGFERAPSRKTIRRRFLEMPGYIRWLLPNIARDVCQMDERFQMRVGYVDKSVFRALGGIWHKKHRLLGLVPHRSIDTDASWAKSAYHGWRFGYGLHLVANQRRFPLAALVTTAAAPDKDQLRALLNGLLPDLYILVGDAGYRVVRMISQLWVSLEVFVLTCKPFSTLSKFKIWYNQWLQKKEASLIYRRRKPSVEPAFALIKELFDLKGETQLPYRGLPKVQAFLLVCVATIQFLMVFNLIFDRSLGDSEHFLALTL
jgi:hypothetical protein